MSQDPIDGSSKKRSRQRLLMFAVIFVCVTFMPALLVFRSMVFEPFRIPAGSMSPTLLNGDQVIVDKASYGWHYPLTRTPVDGLSLPRRGDVVVFVFPGSDTGKASEKVDIPISGLATLDYVKRVIGLPGDTVEVTEGQLILNGEPVPAQKTGTDTYTDDRCREAPVDVFEESLDGRTWTTWRTATYGMQMPDFGPVTVPEGQLFMLGDNRDSSSDSRVWGFVPLRNLKGKVKFVWMSRDACAGRLRDERSGIEI